MRHAVNGGHAAAQPDLHAERPVVAEPRITVALPVIRLFVLRALNKMLAKQAVLVVQAIANRRLAGGGHRIEKTGGQPSQTAVAQRRIGFTLQHVTQRHA